MQQNKSLMHRLCTLPSLALWSGRGLSQAIVLDFHRLSQNLTSLCGVWTTWSFSASGWTRAHSRSLCGASTARRRPTFSRSFSRMRAALRKQIHNTLLQHLYSMVHVDLCPSVFSGGGSMHDTIFCVAGSSRRVQYHMLRGGSARGPGSGLHPLPECCCRCRCRRCDCCGCCSCGGDGGGGSRQSH